jgi:hypothetical protein
MRIDVYQLHGKDHDNKPEKNRECGCLGEPGTTVAIDVPCLPPVGSGIWVQGRSGAWREVTVERYTFGDPSSATRSARSATRRTFGDPKDPGRIRCSASYNADESRQLP